MNGFTIKYARRSDAPIIARMSRGLIESGLGWSWRPKRVLHHIQSPDSYVLVARSDAGRVAAFAIARFDHKDAHLLLLAVHPDFRRRGLGRGLIDWLEKAAMVAGTRAIHLEVRDQNVGAQSFYTSLGFRATERVLGYYRGRESALRMVMLLRSQL